jgi:hypothetical protein
MTDEPTDRALCESIGLQAKLLTKAYESGDPKVIDDALIRVTEARRMVVNGMYDLIYADDLRYPDDGSLSSDP